MIRSSIQNEKTIFHKLISELNEGDFYNSKTKSIFKTIRKFNEQGILPDLTNVWEENHETMATEISQWTDQCESIYLSENYIKQAKDYSMQRSLMIGYQELISSGEDISADRILARMSEVKSMDIDFNYQPVHIKEVISNFLRTMSIPKSGRNLISFGFDFLDNLLYGIDKEELVVVAGSTSVGKTSFAIKMLIKNSIKHNIPGAYFAIESGNKVIVARILSQMTKIPLKNIVVNNLNSTESRIVVDAMSLISEHKFILDDKETLGVNKLRALAETYKIEDDIQYIIIDHLNEMASDGRFGSPYQEKSYQVAEIKKLARHLKIPIILLAQLARFSNKESQVPTMSKIRDSGRIEEIADKVILLYRDNENFKIEVAKNRNGEKPIYTTMFIPEIADFMD